MATSKKKGIHVKCIYCKKDKVLTFDEAAAVKDVVMCDCGGVMVVSKVVT